MSTSNGFGQQTAVTAASTRHPRHLPTPIITQHSKMAMKNITDPSIMQPRQQKSLPSLNQVIGGSERPSNFDASSIRSGPSPGSTPTLEAWRNVPNAPRPAFDADEVMKKAMETMNKQIRANGFDPDNLPNRLPTGHLTAINPSNGQVIGSDPNNLPNSNGPTHPNGFNHASDHAAGADNEEMESDPYQERADAIGLSHRIPGVGHLGDLLTPPGWKPGDEPISINRARLLQKQTYEAAKKNLDDSIAEFKDLKGAAFQEASDLRNEEWQNLNDLNKLVCEERVKVWAERQERKKNDVQERPQQLPIRSLPRSNGVHQPATRVFSGPATYYSHINRPAPPALTLSRPNNGFDGPEPSPNLISPSILDPSLVPTTVEAVIRDYHEKKAHIARLHRINQLRLNQFLTRYGQYLHPSHQPLGQAVRQVRPTSDPEQRVTRQAPSTRPLAQQPQQHPGIHDGQHYDEPGHGMGRQVQPGSPDQRPEYLRPEDNQQHHGSVYGPTARQAQVYSRYPTPPPGHASRHPESYMRSSNGQADNGQHGENGNKLTTNRYFLNPHQTGLGIYEEPSDLALTPVKPQHHNQEAEDIQAEVETTNTPSKKRKAPTKKPSPKKTAASKPAAKTVSKPAPKPAKPTLAAAKKQPWYASHLANANLPTSSITPEAVEAALAYDPKGPARATAPPPTKKRRRGSEPVPVPAFVMPEDKIKLLFKSGMPIRYTGPGANPYLEDGGANAKGGKKEGAPVVPAMGNSDAEDGVKAHAVGSKDSPLTVDETSSAALSGYSTESKADDSKDATYGVPRKSGGVLKRTSPRKSVLAKRARGGDEE